MKINSTTIFLTQLILISVFLLVGCNKNPGLAKNSTVQNITLNYPKINFEALSTLPDGYVDTPYNYSFCDPAPARVSDLCGPEPINPSGSDSTFSFYLGSGVGFPPIGISLNLNGLLMGTAKGVGQSKFEVCTKDTGGNSDCKDVTLNILPKQEVEQPGQPGTENNNVSQNKTAKSATVTVTDGSCVIVEKYEGVGIDVLRQMGAKYARIYDIKVSGSMTGSEGAQMIISTDPIVATTKPDKLSCGSWEYDSTMRTCTRTSSSPENMQWSYDTQAYGEQVNVNPNLQVTAQATISIDYQPKDRKTYTVTCPSVTY